MVPITCRASLCAASSSRLRMLVSPRRKLRTPPPALPPRTPPWYRETETTVLNLIHGELLAGNWVVGDQVNNRGIRQEIRRVRLCPELADVPIGVFLVKYSQCYHIFTLLTSHPRVFYMPVFGLCWWMCVGMCCTTGPRVNWRILRTLFRPPSPPFWGNPLAFLEPDPPAPPADVESVSSSSTVSSSPSLK